MIIEVRLGDRELLGRHVETDDVAALADELREDEGVAPRAAAEVERGRALERRRQRRAAAIELVAHLVVDLGLDGGEMGRQLLGRAAGAGLQVGGALEDAAVIVAHRLERHLVLRVHRSSTCRAI